MAEFTHLTDDNFEKQVASLPQGVILAHKKLCPHCANMKKVLERFSAFAPEVQLFLVDTEEEPLAKAAMQAERVPTVAIVKNNTIRLCKTGLFNPQELLTLYQGA